MSGSNVWTRSREKMRNFSDIFSKCADEAAAYGKCVAATTAGRQELKKDLCAKEFEALKTCFVKAYLKKKSTFTTSANKKHKPKRNTKYNICSIKIHL
uniref:NADH:ubiquinone oxidoreductase complex assembly factor 8 n=1 Tax=Oryzias sinensis TaxID=183150 RepID=A0A8C7ZD96_9TELE